MVKGVRPGARRAIAVLVLAAAVLVTAACQSSPPEPTEAPTPSAEPRPVGTSQPVAVSFSPLRGTTTDPAAPAHPSLAVKIDDHEEARPQIALNRTDLVFEELVEGGITRYVAVWHSDVPDSVGPVRSIRPMDPDIVTPLGGIIAYSGGQDQFVAMMMATPLKNIVFDYDDTGLFHRADERPGPHDVILRSKEAVGRNAKLDPPPVQFAYGTADPLADPALKAAPTSKIALVFSDARNPSWDWDAGTSSWLRSQEGRADTQEGGERVRATNVVTMRVGIDWRYGEVPKTVMVGSGEVWVSSAGRTAHGTWKKDSQAAPIVLTADDGSPLRLAPGNTWIELVPKSGSVKFAP
ncbi:DUF3048 domain-containing protein [Agromyces sp. H3Y2-19a]|jgi:hypothetical protein|uniref:DUF3048 domain-containing protein n=1 Tax=Agromyces TaxID=33877 RepID=UPI0023B92018|nr:DUF3048 domain-containing protein [Agromyces chromiiresistens]MDF0512791.1 DUF3048 domain-containing protein [Agromyces chromiiresistens]